MCDYQQENTVTSQDDSTEAQLHTVRLGRDDVKLIVDVDTGVDDAQALLMALSLRGTVNLLAVTCVAGNAELDQACVNTMRVLKLCNATEVQ